MAINKNRNITRIEGASTFGYEVRLMRQGQKWCRLFSDNVCGGKRKALAAAREYRDHLLEETQHMKLSRKEVASRKSRRNTSGTVGVRLVTEYDDRASQGYYEYYEAQWCPSPGVRRKRRFSVSKYGKRKAKQLAVEARAQGVEEMQD